MTTEPATMLVNDAHGQYVLRVLVNNYRGNLFHEDGTPFEDIDYADLSDEDVGEACEAFDFLEPYVRSRDDDRLYRIAWMPDGALYAIHPDAEWSDHDDWYRMPDPDWVVRATAPSHWASYFINGDASGLADADRAQAAAWLEHMGYGAPVDCEDVGFIRFHDAHGFSSYATDCQVYIFHDEPARRRALETP